MVKLSELKPGQFWDDRDDFMADLDLAMYVGPADDMHIYAYRRGGRVVTATCFDREVSPPIPECDGWNWKPADHEQLGQTIVPPEFNAETIRQYAEHYVEVAPQPSGEFVAVSDGVPAKFPVRDVLEPGQIEISHADYVASQIVGSLESADDVARVVAETRDIRECIVLINLHAGGDQEEFKAAVKALHEIVCEPPGELVEFPLEPLQVEAGKFYERRNGGVVGPAERETTHTYGATHPWRVGVLTYTDDGRCTFSAEDVDDPIREVPPPEKAEDDAPDPGEDWRLIDTTEDEPQEGDEYWNDKDRKWLPRPISTSAWFLKRLTYYRRRIEPQYRPFANNAELRAWLMDESDEDDGRWLERKSDGVVAVITSFGSWSTPSSSGCYVRINGERADMQQLLDEWVCLATEEPCGVRLP